MAFGTKKVVSAAPVETVDSIVADVTSKIDRLKTLAARKDAEVTKLNIQIQELSNRKDDAGFEASRALSVAASLSDLLGFTKKSAEAQ
jgi:hypothetical protein